ncbi:Anaphase-promoting complex subunit 8 [Coemansia sp. RSA 2599]|nr:Anaphase-promoting complex subunit 8 [Coemansia sp. RSA 2599]
MDTGYDSLRSHLRESVEECSGRGLVYAAKWAAEQLCSLTAESSAIPKITGVPLAKPATTPTLKHRLRGASRQLALATEAEDDRPRDAEQERRDRWSRLDSSERDKVALAKCLFDMREFDRVRHLLEECQGPRAVFLGLYARYLSRERRITENGSRGSESIEGRQVAGESDSELVAIRDELEARDSDGDLDAFGVYLLAMVQSSLGQRQLARKACIRSLSMYEYNWSAWQLLETCVDPREPLDKLSGELPGGWMRHAFLAHALLEVFTPSSSSGSGSVSNTGGNSGSGSGNGSSNKSSTNSSSSSSSSSGDFAVHCQVLEQLFPQSQFVIGLCAVRHYNMREFEEARRLFGLLQKIDPYRLELADIHSNILYVMEDRARLGELAHRCAELDRFRPETCCVIGNYYSLRREHEKAVSYFQKALQLDRNYLAAWTLMGHEFIEMKNTAAAIDAYRNAVDVDEKDYRAWYGLGQTYEMLNMSHYAINYYARAASLRPYDSRMWCALGNCYEQSKEPGQAIDCYRRALVGSSESESLAISRLARLYESTGNRERAAYYYQLLYEHALKNGAHALYPAGGAVGELGSGGGGGNVGGGAVHGGQDELAAACLFLAAFEHERGRKQVAQRYLTQVIDGASSGGASQQRVEEAKAMMRALSSQSS